MMMMMTTTTTSPTPFVSSCREVKKRSSKNVRSRTPFVTERQASLAAVLFDDDEDNGVLYHQTRFDVYIEDGPLRRRVLRQLFSILRESVRGRAENARQIWTDDDVVECYQSKSEISTAGGVGRRFDGRNYDCERQR